MFLPTLDKDHYVFKHNPAGQKFTLSLTEQICEWTK